MTPLAYAEWGDGRPLVLLHAFPLARQMWKFQYDGLTTSLRLLTPDLPGFGESPPSDEQPDLGVMADGVIALVDDLGLRDVVLGGLSMGGYVVMEVLRRRPGLAAAVILADTKADADLEPARDNRERIAGVLEDGGSPQVLIEEILPKLLGDTTHRERPETVALVREMIELTDPQGAAWAQRAMARRPASWDILGDIDVPALVVVGEEDTLSPPTDAKQMVAALPRADLVVIPAAGHLPAVETADAFNDAICNFAMTARRTE